MERKQIILNNEQKKACAFLQKEFIEILAKYTSTLANSSRDDIYYVTNISLAFFICNIMDTYDIKSKKKEYLSELFELVIQLKEGSIASSFMTFDNGKKTGDGLLN